MFTLTDVSQLYGTQIVLRNVNAQLSTDGITAIMGASGAGKSTLLRLLAMLELPASGRLQLILNGITYKSGEGKPPWPALTYVFQRQFLWPHLTIRQNIQLPLQLNHQYSSLQEKTHEVVEMFEMGHFIDRYPNEVSVGQAQRAALARAFVLSPQLILMDEAHSALDLAQQSVLNGHMLKLRQAGVGLLVVTHSLSFAGQFADHIVVVEDHSIAENGAAKLLESPSSRYLRGAVSLDHRLSNDSRRPTDNQCSEPIQEPNSDGAV